MHISWTYVLEGSFSLEMEIVWACESPFSYSTDEPVDCQKVINMHKEKAMNINIWCFAATSQYSKFSDISECFLFT